MDRLNLNITSELELLKEMDSFLQDIQNGIYSDSDIVQLLISIEQAILDSPKNKYLKRLKSWVRAKSKIEVNY